MFHITTKNISFTISTKNVRGLIPWFLSFCWTAFKHFFRTPFQLEVGLLRVDGYYPIFLPHSHSIKYLYLLHTGVRFRSLFLNIQLWNHRNTVPQTKVNNNVVDKNHCKKYEHIHCNLITVMLWLKRIRNENCEL